MSVHKCICCGSIVDFVSIYPNDKLCCQCQYPKNEPVISKKDNAFECTINGWPEALFFSLGLHLEFEAKKRPKPTHITR